MGAGNQSLRRKNCGEQVAEIGRAIVGLASESGAGFAGGNRESQFFGTANDGQLGFHADLFAG